MIANYHTHTYRCHHAYGCEWEYVENAIAGGLKVLGFSDHIPNPLNPGHLGVRMGHHQLKDYIEVFQKMKKLYGDRITLRCGLEVEYEPVRFAAQQEMLAEHPGIEYLLMGQHLYCDKEGRIYTSTTATAEEWALAAYVDQVLAGLSTGKFLYLAHPDTLNFVGEDSLFKKHYRRLCRETKAMDIPLEINGQGLRAGKFYPNLKFWELAAEEGCRVVLGTDAHTPAVTYKKQEADTLRDIARSFHLPIIESLEDRL
ncbi:MAG: PHP domain-containing protein [Clostridia bacterium]|nr:PHP domain-containing protein [Clostridia bacterium]